MNRLLLVEKRVLLRECLAVLISPRLDCANVQAGTPDEARRVLPDLEGEVALSIVGLDFPNGAAIELIRELRETERGAAILAFTDGRDPRAQTLALRAGADEVLTLRVTCQHFLDTAVSLKEVTQRHEGRWA